MPLARFPSPTQTRVFPGLAIYDWSKSETSDLDAGEGDGVCRSDDLNFTKPARGQEPGRGCGLAGGAAAVVGFLAAGFAAGLLSAGFLAAAAAGAVPAPEAEERTTKGRG